MNATAHPFERAGLGVAPFQYAGMQELVYQACPGAPTQAAGTCDYCGTGIRYAVIVRSADGAEFKIGTDCALKLYRQDNVKADALLVSINEERRRIQREQRHAREKVQITKAEKFIAENREELARHPHPYHKQEWASELTLVDYVEWMWKNAGTSGKLQTFRMARRIIA